MRYLLERRRAPPVGEARHDDMEGQQGVTWQGARGSVGVWRGKNKIDNIRAINNIIIFYYIFKKIINNKKIVNSKNEVLTFKNTKEYQYNFKYTKK